MAAFDYVAIDINGRRDRGVLEADSARQARNLLRDRALTVLSLSETSSLRKLLPRTGSSYPLTRLFSKSPTVSIGLRDVSALTRQLGSMLQAGLTIDEALRALSRQNSKPAIKSVVTSVRAQVVEGHTLAASLGLFPGVFSELYCTSVAAGEQSGHLGLVLEYLADFSERSHQLRQKIFLALLYPMVLTVVSCIIIAFLMVYIVPNMVHVFSDAGHTLPFLTRFLIRASAAIQSYGLIFLVLAVSAGYYLRRRLNEPSMRLAVDEHMLGWPLVGSLIREHSAVRFAATLGMLQESGVTLVLGIDITASIIVNRHIRFHIEGIAKQVREGTSLSWALEKSEVFPPILATMVSSGEVSGGSGPMLSRASSMMQRDVENKIAIIVGLFEPLVLLIMGGIVLLLVLAIILPTLDLNQLIN